MKSCRFTRAYSFLFLLYGCYVVLEVVNRGYKLVYGLRSTSHNVACYTFTTSYFTVESVIVYM